MDSVIVSKSESIAGGSSDITITLTLNPPVTWDGDVTATFDPIEQKFVVVLKVSPEINPAPVHPASAIANGHYPAALRPFATVRLGSISPFDLTGRD